MGTNSSTPKEVICEMARAELISNPETWFGFLEARNLSSYSYGEDVAKKIQNFSDIDLLYEFSDELDLSFIFKIKSALTDSNFPVKVDIVNIKDLADSYKLDILEKRVPV